MDDSRFSLAAENDGRTLRLKLAGDFDRAATGQVDAAVDAARGYALERLVLDLSALTFVDLAALRTLLRVHRRAQADAGAMTVIRPRGLANRVFTLTRAGETLPLVDAAD